MRKSMLLFLLFIASLVIAVLSEMNETDRTLEDVAINR